MMICAAADRALQVVADYLADPLVFSGPVRAKFAHLTKGAIEETMAHVIAPTPHLLRPPFLTVPLPLLRTHPC
jgi:hypothetical protein